MTQYTSNIDISYLASTFEVEPSTFDGMNFKFAAFEYENYEGYCLVVFEQGGQLYEVSGSHCSCYGFEGQWEPAKTHADALKKRVCWWFDESYKKNWAEFLETLP